MGTIIGLAAIGLGVIFALVFIVWFLIVKFLGDEEAAVAALVAVVPAGIITAGYAVLATAAIILLAILNSVFAWGL